MPPSAMVPFHCPSCGSMLGKADGDKLQTYCRHCKAVRIAYSEIARLSTSATATAASGKGMDRA